MESSGPGSGVFSGILRVRPLPDGRGSIEPPCVSMRTGATKSKRASSEEPALGLSIGDVEALLSVSCTLFTVALARESFLGALLLTRFQVEGMPLDFLNDVLLLDLALETAQRAFQGFSVLDVDFCQTRLTSLLTAALCAAPDTTGHAVRTPDVRIVASCSRS